MPRFFAARLCGHSRPLRPLTGSAVTLSLEVFERRTDICGGKQRMSMAVDGPLQTIETASFPVRVAAYDPLGIRPDVKHWLKRQGNRGNHLFGGVTLAPSC